MGRTINNMSLSDALKSLRAYKPRSKKLDFGSNFSYYSIEECVQGLDNVIGVDHYNVEYTDCAHFSNGAGQEGFSVKCRITLLDDDYQPIFFKEGLGIQEEKFKVDKDYKSNSNFEGDSHNASTAAFKNACKWLGLFGQYGYNAENPTESNDKDTKARKSNSSNLITVNIITDGGLFEAGSKDEKTIWKVKFHKELKGGNKPSYDQLTEEMIFYPADYKDIPDEMNKLYSEASKGAACRKVILRACNKQRDNLNQYVFKGFDKN